MNVIKQDVIEAMHKECESAEKRFPMFASDHESYAVIKEEGDSVCSFALAVDRMKKKDQQNAEVDWIDCQAWRQSADFLGSYAHKGSTVALDGRLQTIKSIRYLHLTMRRMPSHWKNLRKQSLNLNS